MDNIILHSTWELKDGRTLSYFRINNYEFSNLPEEDFNYETAQQTAEAWQQWAEYVKNNPHLSAGAATVDPETVNNETVEPEEKSEHITVEHIPQPPLPEKTREYAAGYAAGFADGEAKNAPPF